jgi:tRNA modification GTPase
MDLYLPEQLENISGKYKEHLGPGETFMTMSAKSGLNLALLEEALLACSGLANINENDVIITNVRHYDAINKSLFSLRRASEGLHTGLPADLIAQDIREALYFLGEITGEISNDEVLGNIFKNFCIGK